VNVILDEENLPDGNNPGRVFPWEQLRAELARLRAGFAAGHMHLQ
jgi:hypothetical protein